MIKVFLAFMLVCSYHINNIHLDTLFDKFNYGNTKNHDIFKVRS